MWIEYFGTLMSVIVVVSLMQKNIRWLRIINGIGAWPVLALNAVIFFVDLWFLTRMRNTDDHFDYLQVDGLKSAYVRKFIDFHNDDIRTFMPEFDSEDREGVKGCLILRDIRPVAPAKNPSRLISGRLCFMDYV